MKKIYEEGSLGQVFRIESRVHGSRGIPGDWRQEKEHGGGMILDWGVHLLDQLLQMMGNTKLKRVYANVTNITNTMVDDGFTAHLSFENGVEALVEVGTSNFISLPRCL
jgi:predicted dehydrogenase